MLLALDPAQPDTGYCSRLAQTVSNFADASHFKLATPLLPPVLLLTIILCCGYNKDTFKLVVRPYFFTTGGILYGIQNTGHLLQRNPF